MGSVASGEDRNAPEQDNRGPNALGHDAAADTIRLQLTVCELLL
jgi:hypothetical protein